MHKRMFSGFRSQWIIPASFNRANPCRIYFKSYITMKEKQKDWDIKLSVKQSPNSITSKKSRTCLENNWTMVSDSPLKWFILISSYLNKCKFKPVYRGKIKQQLHIIEVKMVGLKNGNSIHNQRGRLAYRLVSSSSKQMHKWRWYTK